MTGVLIKVITKLYIHENISLNLSHGSPLTNPLLDFTTPPPI